MLNLEEFEVIKKEENEYYYKFTVVAKDRYEAFQRFYEWECRIPDDMKPFKDLQKTYNNNKKEIFNYFLQPYTNAYTESVNNIIKSVEK